MPLDGSSGITMEGLARNAKAKLSLPSSPLTRLPNVQTSLEQGHCEKEHTAVMLDLSALHAANAAK